MSDSISNDMDFTFDERLGIFFIVLAGSLSLAATLWVLGIAGFRGVKKRTAGQAYPSGPINSGLFINLMLADMLQALGALPNIKWMHDAATTSGPLCTCQGVLKHLGVVGVSTTSLAIAAYTFAILVLECKSRSHTTAMITAAVWIFIFLVTVIPNIVDVSQGLYGPTGFWCWIRREYVFAQLFVQYFWVWLDGFLMLIFYTIIFMATRGWLDNRKICWFKSRKTSGNGEEQESDEHKEIKAIAMKLLFYPAVYIVCVFPNSLARWLSFSGHNVPHQFTLFANTIYTLSGAFDVALFLITTNREGPKQIETTHAMNLLSQGQLPNRQDDLTSSEAAHHGLVERDTEDSLTLEQDQVFEYGHPSDRRRESPTSLLQGRSMYGNLREC